MSEIEPSVELRAFSAPDAQATPLLAVWSLGGMCFTTGARERKALNLEHNPRCVLTTGTNTLTGTDVVIEGVASVVEGSPERKQAAADFERKYGTHLTSPEGTWYGLGEAVIAGDTRLYRVTPTVGFAFGKLPTSSQTRYRWSRP